MKHCVCVSESGGGVGEEEGKREGKKVDERTG